MADDDRTIPATPRRREAARRAGLGAPADLPAWAAAAGTAMLLAPAWARTTIPAAAESFRETAAAAFGGDATEVPWPLPAAVVLPTLAVAVASAAAGMVVRAGCEGLSWQPGRAVPDPRRVALLAGLRRILSWDTLVSLATAVAGSSILLVVACVAARPLFAARPLPASPAELGGLAALGWRAIAAVLAAAAAIAVGQWLVARRRFERRIRMTPRELADELGDLQADPRVRRRLEGRQPPAPTSGTA